MKGAASEPVFQVQRHPIGGQKVQATQSYSETTRHGARTPPYVESSIATEAHNCPTFKSAGYLLAQITLDISLR